MKKVYLLFYLLFLCQLFAQKKYLFDHALLIKEKYKVNDQKFNSVFLVNSKNNSYRLYAHNNIDTLNYTMHFVDQNGVSFNSLVSKIDFHKAETISNTCKEVVRFSNPYKEKSKNYFFVNYKDTIINDTSYYHYAIKCNKKLKYQKRKKIVTIHYVVEKQDSNFLPFTYFSTIYETWKRSKSIPTGCPKLIYFINTIGEETGRMEISKIKVIKYATFPEECDYSNPEIRKNSIPKIFVY
jgi:hypothetical protein